MVTVQGGRNYRRSRHEGGIIGGQRRGEGGEERRGTETNRETQGGWRGGLGDCVRARQSGMEGSDEVRSRDELLCSVDRTKQPPMLAHHASYGE